MAAGTERGLAPARPLPQRWRRLILGWSRRRLARRVRAHARAERQHRFRAGAVEFRSIDGRTAAYERIAQRLDERDRPLPPCGVARLRQLLSERLPLCDYGPYARARDARVASILAELERGN